MELIPLSLLFITPLSNNQFHSVVAELPTWTVHPLILSLSTMTVSIEPNLPGVREYYANKDILVTGGTGYLGKVLIEKLLRSCPDVGRIFVLIRKKRGKTPEERLQKFRDDFVFHLLKQENPAALEKISHCSGDVRELGLGLDEETFQRIRGCSIFIHCAATVRFDDTPTDAILMNTRGTREALLLAKRMDNVEVFNHISTTYCNVTHVHSFEKLYPVDVNWKEAIKMAEELDEATLSAIVPILMQHHPNTYTFSKQMTEHLVNEMRQECDFPVLILRPSMGEWFLG